MEVTTGVICLYILSLSMVNAIPVNPCTLAKDLLAKGVPKSELGDWLCLVKYESSYNPQAINHNDGGSTDYGIFQINDGYWCSNSDPNSKDCKVTCSALLTDDLSASINCALLIKSRQGFPAWYGWKNHCRGQDLSSYTADCGL